MYTTTHEPQAVQKLGLNDAPAVLVAVHQPHSHLLRATARETLELVFLVNLSLAPFTQVLKLASPTFWSHCPYELLNWGPLVHTPHFKASLANLRATMPACWIEASESRKCFAVPLS